MRTCLCNPFVDFVYYCINLVFYIPSFCRRVFFFVPISFWYLYLDLLVKGVVTADIAHFLTAYIFGVSTCIFCSFMVLATVKYVLEIYIPIFVTYVQSSLTFTSCFLYVGMNTIPFILFHLIYCILTLF